MHMQLKLSFKDPSFVSGLTDGQNDSLNLKQFTFYYDNSSNISDTSNYEFNDIKQSSSDNKNDSYNKPNFTFDGRVVSDNVLNEFIIDLCQNNILNKNGVNYNYNDFSNNHTIMIASMNSSSDVLVISVQIILQ